MGVTVPIRPKESKLERFERLEKERLANRRPLVWCGREDAATWPDLRAAIVARGGCGYRLTSRASGLCRSCEKEEFRRGIRTAP